MSPAEVHVVPGVQPWGPGWYLIGANNLVELGPFSTPQDAEYAAAWMDEHGYGRNPLPYSVHWSPRGLKFDTRRRDRHRGRSAEQLTATG